MKKVPFTYHGQQTIAEVQVSSTYPGSKWEAKNMFDDNHSTRWCSLNEAKGPTAIPDRDPFVIVNFYSIKEVNQIKIVRNTQDHGYRYANLCFTLLDDTDNELDKKCTWLTGFHGQPYLNPKTDDVEVNFHNIQNVKKVKLDFGDPTDKTGQVHELFIYGLHLF